MRGNGAEDIAAERVANTGLNPLLRHDKFLLLVLLLLEAEREDIQQQQGRRLFVRTPRVVFERRDARTPLFLSGLAQQGVSQTSQGDLENGSHTPEVSWE